MAASTHDATAGASGGRSKTRGGPRLVVGVARPLVARPAGRPLLWMPALLVGAGLYWSLALGLGSRSFALLAMSDEQLEIAPELGAGEPIVVHLVSEAADSLTSPSAGDPQAGCAAEREPGADDVRIGRTAF